MDNLRTLFIFGLLIVSLLLWQAWQKDYVHPQQTEQNTPSTQIDDAPAAANDAELPDLPSASAQALPDVPESAQSSAATKQNIHVKTDVMDVQISTQGGDIQNLALLKYAVSSEEPNTPVQFLSDESSAYFVAQSGLRSNEDAPTHYSIFRAEQQNYQLQDGQDELTVPLYWQADNGLTVIKTYTFKRDSYVVNVDYKVVNNTGEAFSAYPYAQFNRNKETQGSHFIYTYTGPVFSNTGNEYEKVKFEDLDDKPFNQKAADGWAAMIEHYFVAAIVPEQNAEEKGYYARSINGTNYTAGVRMPAMTVAAGAEGHADYEMYLGPKKADRLEKVAKNLQLTVDYGIFTIISEPLFWVMEWLHKLTGNWGWSIVLLTVLIKLVFFKLSAASYRSMAAMRKLTPKLASLKERYGDDKQKFNQAMMDLYRTEKINPLGGCLPILVQMPVFLSFYWVLVESIELRQADFILWINDLTAMDPYFILPVLFGISMWFQQTLNPAPQDPAQAMMMKFFPLVFTVFFAFFPSGLVLYWVVNNVLSIAQQWYITRKMDAL
ncbi:membrane protein insertase YidC [Methylophaga thalassica]|uniref:membrane protein insertase YidC n=1 Tax=Methylophaga thalassica TaxID=40223 RepID=UPI002E7BB891|nr:membrane protein insertase YidC [Methylophaga thalassica]WVI85328.1 membrane protein insertase YidC [Methylophaga thalassica]